ncbi:unnamed protein product [Paramecium sonneborni]|uniref:Uncharacterized protein n=1 Tax=Paramecium sonneborni TaxID=65129 RepID=A0A8S1QDN9_9CILI|nr:unnamed protein product [Paramecium sonneborni]
MKYQIKIMILHIYDQFIKKEKFNKLKLNLLKPQKFKKWIYRMMMMMNKKIEILMIYQINKKQKLLGLNVKYQINKELLQSLNKIQQQSKLK